MDHCYRICSCQFALSVGLLSEASVLAVSDIEGVVELSAVSPLDPEMVRLSPLNKYLRHEIAIDPPDHGAIRKGGPRDCAEASVTAWGSKLGYQVVFPVGVFFFLV